jgi:hypothetical protein
MTPGDGSSRTRSSTSNVTSGFLPRVPTFVREDNVGRLKTQLVLQGANILFTRVRASCTSAAVLVIPDFTRTPVA